MLGFYLLKTSFITAQLPHELPGYKEGRELYDQINDPIEYNNLAEDPEYAEVILKMRTLLYQSR